MESVLKEALTNSPSVVSCVACFAGLINAELESNVSKVLENLLPDSLVRCYPDYVAAVLSSKGQYDLVLIAGTGSVCCSLNQESIVKSGGGGPLIGDFGSAFDIGRTYLNEALLNPASLDLVLDDSFPMERDQIFPSILSSEFPVSLVAALAPAIGQAASSGDVAAIKAVHRVEKLAQLVEAHCDRYFAHQYDIKVGLVGGLWKAHDIYQEALCKTLKKGPEYADFLGLNLRLYEVSILHQPPVWGAAQCAKSLFYGNRVPKSTFNRS